MGQNFKVINLDKKEYLAPWDYGNNSEIMRHSWIGNGFVCAVEKLLSKNEKWYQNRIVWAGDYMDNGLFLDKNIINKNLYNYAIDKFIRINPIIEIEDMGRFVINYTKKEFVDKERCIGGKRWNVHPLPLLISSGNGKGQNDYKPINDLDKKYIGIWAGDIISIENDIIKDFKEIIPNFYSNIL